MADKIVAKQKPKRLAPSMTPSENRIFASDLTILHQMWKGASVKDLLMSYMTSTSWVYNRISYLVSINALTKKHEGRSNIIVVTPKGVAISKAYDEMLKVIKGVV